MKTLDKILYASIVALVVALVYKTNLLVGLTLAAFYIVLAIIYGLVAVFVIGLITGKGGNIFCRHKYKVVWRKDLQGGYFDECEKCGRLRV